MTGRKRRWFRPVTGPRRRWLSWRHAPTVTGVLAALATIGQVVAEASGNGLFGNLGWLPLLVMTIGSVLLQRVVSRRTSNEQAEDPPAPPNTPLPPPVDLLGRDPLVDAAAGQLRAQGLLLVHGPVGMGVSAVAVEAARRVVPAPASQEYVNLLGEGAPVGENQPKPDSARRVALRVLSALGVAQRMVPNVEAAGRRVRDELRDSGRVLVLDNVTDPDQISWLVDHVPGAYLVAAGSFEPSGLPGPAEFVGPLDGPTALELMARQDPGGPGPSVRDRIESDPAGARELADRYLGQARTAIAVGEWLARNPRISLRALLDDLGDREPSRMAGYVRGLLLAGGSDDAKALLAALARVPVTVLPESAMAALADADLPRTAAVLDELIRQRVVQRIRPARYLVLEEARALGATVSRSPAGAPARLVRYYGLRAANHARALSSDPKSDAATRAREWFRTEDAALTQLLGMADPPRRAAALWRIADALEVWFTAEARLTDRWQVATAMARAAERIGDRTAQLTARLRLIAICRLRGELADADRHLVAAQDLLGDGVRAGRGGAGFHTNRGLLHLTDGRGDQAHQDFQRSARRRPREDEVGQVVDLTNLGAVLLQQRHLNTAHARLSEALALAERSGDVTGQAHAQELLGLVAYRQHDEKQAWELWAKAGVLYERQGATTGQARCLAHSAAMLLERGRDGRDVRDGMPGRIREGAADRTPDRAATEAEAEEMLLQSLELRGSQDTGLGPALAHLRLARLASGSGRAELARRHREQGLAALRGWDQRRQEPPEVTVVRDQLDALA